MQYLFFCQYDLRVIFNKYLLFNINTLSYFFHFHSYLWFFQLYAEAPARIVPFKQALF